MKYEKIIENNIMITLYYDTSILFCYFRIIKKVGLPISVKLGLNKSCTFLE